MPSLPLGNNPSMVGKGWSQVGVTGVGGPNTIVILPGVSIGELELWHLEYVARIVPQSTWTSRKRVRAEDSSTSASTYKKPHSSSAQITGSMLLGEHINDLLLPFCSGFFSHLSSWFVQMVLWWSYMRMWRKTTAWPSSPVGE
jgi:hypothetical protein